MGAPLVRRELRHRPARMAFMFATVTIAVSFCVAAFGFSAQLSVQLESDGDLGTLALPIGTIAVTPDTNGATTATAIDDGLTQQVLGIEGVLDAFGVLDQPVSFRVTEREQPDRPVQLRGLVLSSGWDPARWRIVEGRVPLTPDEVAVDVGGAVVGLAPLGTTTPLQLPTGTRRVEVVGLAEPASSDTAAGDGLAAGAAGDVAKVAVSSAHVVLAADHAAAMLGAVGKVDRISVVPDVGTDPELLAGRLSEELPAGLLVTVVTDRAQSTQQTVASIDSGVRTGTRAFAVLTVLVAGFAVVNVQTVVLAQRTRELALLRLVGASRHQLGRVVLSEALVVGGAATVVGLGLGTFLGYLAVSIVDPLGVAAALLLTPSMVSAALVVGLLVTLAGGLWPALRAARATPLEALSDTGAGGEARAFGPILPVTRLLSRALVPWLGVTARLGVGNAGRRPGRSVAAGATLMVTLALVASVATLGAGARLTVSQQFENAGSADLYLERRGLVRVDTASLADSINSSVGGLSAAAEVVSVDGVLVGPRGTQRQVSTSGLRRLSEIMDLEVTARDPQTRPSNGAAPEQAAGVQDAVMLSESAADRVGVGVGDPLTLRSTSGRETELRVVATYRNTAFVGPAVVEREAVAAVGAEGTFELAALEVAEGASIRRVARQLNRVADSFPKVRVHSPREFAELNTGVTDTVLGVIGVLLAGSVGIGFLGLASTQALSTIERRRELVMLRAVGASRAQIRALVGVEAAVIAATASVLGLALGIVIGWFGASLAPQDLIGGPVVPWAMLVAVGAAASVTAAAVSLLVARRANALPPADAGRSD